MVKYSNRKGEVVQSTMAEAIDSGRATLLSDILAMPKKKDISFEEAIRIVSEKAEEAFFAKCFGPKTGSWHWFHDHFTTYISNLGYHIELTGDEFTLFTQENALIRSSIDQEETDCTSH